MVPRLTCFEGGRLSLGFSNFELIPFGANESKYQVVRKSGEIAGPSLGEGEKTLLSFLYFFHHLKSASHDRLAGSQLMAAIDDPISSLDSATLFAVSLLCREILELCSDTSSRLSQVICLTHNVYFFQEVTFLQRGKSATPRPRPQSGQSIPHLANIN